MNDSQVLLDVNVPMYAAGQAHAYKEACVWVMREVAEGRLAAAIDTEMIQEILDRYGALRQWRIAVAMARDLLNLILVVYPVLLADARLAVELFEQYAPQGVKARDLLRVALMQNNGLTTIISTDAHFDRIAGIRRLDPRELFSQAQGNRR